MTDKDRKLAEDTIRNWLYWIQDENIPRHRMILGTDEICELMQAFHEAKMKEVTDEDIERQVKQINRREALCTVDYYSTGFIEGAKAFRDGKIKHKEE